MAMRKLSGNEDKSNNMAMKELCGNEEKSSNMANYSDVSASNSKHVSLYIREPGDALITAIYQINPVTARKFIFYQSIQSPANVNL